MNPESFDKMDETLMKTFKDVREKKVPENNLNAISSSIEARLSRRSAPPAYPLLVAASVLVFLSAALIAFLIMDKNGPKPAGATFHEASALNETGSKMEMRPLGDNELLSEIEALAELGEWNEEDEEKAGIPPDVTFGELEIGWETNSPAANIQNISSLSKG